MPITPSIKALASTLVGAGLFTVAYLMACAPASDGALVGTRGAKRRLALSKGGVWPGLEPFVRWVGTRLALVVPQAVVVRLDNWLTHAGDPLGIGALDFLGLVMLTGALGGSAGLLHGWLNQKNPLVFALVVGLLGAALPWIRVDALRERRLIAIQRGLPPTVDILCLGLSAGLDFPSSVRQYIEKSSSAEDPLVGEFAILLSELQLGKSRREALTLFAERNPISVVKEFVGSVIQAELGGTPLASVFKIQAESSRRRRSVAAEEAAAKTGIKLMIPMMMVFASVLLILMGPLGLKLGDVLK
jgi:tight adherence protein C